MTADRPPVSGEPSTERPHDGSVYLGDHQPLPHGWCRHRWRNRQTRDVICPYSEGYARGLAEARATPPALDVERLTRVLRAIHGDNVPLPRPVPTPPREYAEQIVAMDARIIEEQSRDR